VWRTQVVKLVVNLAGIACTSSQTSSTERTADVKAEAGADAHGVRLGAAERPDVSAGGVGCGQSGVSSYLDVVLAIAAMPKGDEPGPVSVARRIPWIGLPAVLIDRRFQSRRAALVTVRRCNKRCAQPLTRPIFYLCNRHLMPAS
jgi:hypothetical protein